MLPGASPDSPTAPELLRYINNKMLKFLSRNAFKKFMHTIMVQRVKIA